MEVMDCSHKVLTCIVNFMYGFPIPEDFDDPQGLLHQADFFMMEDLKSAVGLLIAKNLSLETLRESILVAERYREVKLQESCMEFILAHMEELDDDLLAELALPPSARVAFQAVKKKEWEKREMEKNGRKKKKGKKNDKNGRSCFWFWFCVCLCFCFCFKLLLSVM